MMNGIDPNNFAFDVERVNEFKLHDEKQFAKGSMLPKVEACMEFVSHGKGKKAIITSLSKASEALKGNTGTVISKEEN